MCLFLFVFLEQPLHTSTVLYIYEPLSIIISNFPLKDSFRFPFFPSYPRVKYYFFMAIN